MFKAEVQLGKEDHARRLYLNALIDPKAAITMKDPEVPADYQFPIDNVINTFVQAIQSGCFGDSLPVRRLTHHLKQINNVHTYEWEFDFPSIPISAFRILLNMVKASIYLGSGVVEFSIRENGIKEQPLLPWEQLKPIASPTPPFQVARKVEHNSKELQIIITFQNALNDKNLNYVNTLLETWTGLLMGGFPVRDSEGICTGQLANIRQMMATSIVATVDFFYASPEAWNVLLLGLINLHRQASINQVEIY